MTAMADVSKATGLLRLRPAWKGKSTTLDNPDEFAAAVRQPISDLDHYLCRRWQVHICLRMDGTRYYHIRNVTIRRGARSRPGPRSPRDGGLPWSSGRNLPLAPAARSRPSRRSLLED
jgi:hypothetical protein